ncbi:hypothetical protein SSX86_029079 [Deinandra increscens subsp. villosa]|uniref:Non-specific lipid-transfer protein n=1 Tax=Deinandra increscens subsp. villosa TaxID=3103831 RepID=A0AAP0C9T4_9ASTR
MKGSMRVAILAMIIMALVMVHPVEGLNCVELAGMLSPCLDYLRSGGEPPEDCCSGVKKAQGAIQSQEDRRNACNCAKSAAGQMKVRADAASDLMAKCGVSTISIDPNVDCNT